MKNKLILCIDFDETITYGDFPKIEGLKPDAKEIINLLYDQGHYIIVFTCRDSIINEQAIGYDPTCSLEAAKMFLYENGVNVHAWNEHYPGSLLKYKNNTRKIFGDIYYDDKNAGKVPTWKEFYEIVQEKSLVPDGKQEMLFSVENNMREEMERVNRIHEKNSKKVLAYCSGGNERTTKIDKYSCYNHNPSY